MSIRSDKPRREGDDDDLREPVRDVDETHEPIRDRIPGSLDHISSDQDQFEGGLIRGAEGRRSDVDDATLEREATAAAPLPPQGVPGEPTRRGAGRFLGFLRASWAELQRVQWPDRRQVGQGTAVTLGFVVVAGAFLGVADEIATRIVDLIL